MTGAMFCVIAAALGVDVGWQPLPEGGLEYIIQIEPHMLEMLGRGEQIASDVPPHVRGVRSYRITVGTDELPREGEAPEPEPPPHEVQMPQAEPTEPRPAEPEEPASETDTDAQPESTDEDWAEPEGSGVPATFPPPGETKPLHGLGEKVASFVNPQPGGPEGSEAEGAGEGKSGADGGRGAESQQESAEGESRTTLPWPLTLALAGMAGSFGGMLYIGWIAWDYRRQYHALLARMIDAGVDRSLVGKMADEESLAEEE